MRVAFADYLPACLVEGTGGPATESFMARFLAVFDELANTVEVQVAGIEHTVDPAVAPGQMLRPLRSWIGFDAVAPGMSEADQRAWALRARELLWLRGTEKGLSGILEMATGQCVQVIDGGGVFPPGPEPSRPGHVTIRLDGVGQLTDRDLIALLHEELPADVTYELIVGDRQVWPPRREP